MVPTIIAELYADYLIRLFPLHRPMSIVSGPCTTIIIRVYFQNELLDIMIMLLDTISPNPIGLQKWGRAKAYCSVE